MERIATVLPTHKQYEALERLWNSTTIELLFGGGAGGGKSYLGCEWIATSALKYPGTRWGVGRKTLQDLKKSTVLTLKRVLKNLGLKEKHDYTHNQQDNFIRLYNGSEIYLLDLDFYPSDPDYERLGSMEFTGIFVDEAGQITSKCRDVLKSRIRFMLTEFGLTPKLLMSCNPTKNWLYYEFYKPYMKGDLLPDKCFIQALASENPHNPSSYLGLLSGIKDKVTRERLYLGSWEYDEDENSLFHSDVISDMFTNSVEESSDMYLVVDAARMGRDRIVMTVWRGLRVVAIYTFEKQGTDVTENKIREIMTSHNVPLSRVLVDEEGVGGGIVDHLKCKGFVGASSPIQDDDLVQESEFRVNYLNLRAQCFFTLSDYASSRRVAIDTDNSDYVQFITEELEQIKRANIDKDGKLQIVAKDEIKRHLGRSPDFADALSMRMYFEVKRELEPTVSWL